MGISRRRVLAAVTAAVAAAGLATVSGSTPASAVDPPVFTLPGFPSDEGVLRLHLGASDYVRFDPRGASGYTVGTQEPLVVSGCNLTSPTSLGFVAGAPNSQNPRLGLVGDAIGVQVRGEGNGTPCGQVNGTAQSLDLRPGGALADMEMDAVELDIEGKFSVTVRADLYLDSTLVWSELLVTGGSDSGPDSADGDNFRWVLPSTTAPVFFDRIVLRADLSTPGGAFSLEGGADGTAAQPGGLGAELGTTDSLFHITDVDGTLACGATATEPGTGGAPTVSIQLVNQAGC